MKYISDHTTWGGGGGVGAIACSLMGFVTLLLSKMLNRKYFVLTEENSFYHTSNSRECMGSLAAACSIFYCKSCENPYQYYKSRGNPYQVLQVM